MKDLEEEKFFLRIDKILFFSEKKFLHITSSVTYKTCSDSFNSFKAFFIPILSISFLDLLIPAVSEI